MQIGVLASIEFVGTTIIHQLHLFIKRQKLMERLMNYSLKSRCRVAEADGGCHTSRNVSVRYSGPVLSLSCIFSSMCWAEARLVGSDVHSSSTSSKLTDSADESVTAATAPAAEQ